MKLSMWLLADRLKGTVSKFNINEEPAQITSVRFFSGDLSEVLPEFVYIGDASEAFSDEGYAQQVLLVHGHDLMFIMDKTVEDVLNDILSIFDFYNSWESSLWAAASGDNAIQKMIDCCEGVMNGPIAIADSHGHLIAFSQEEGPHLHDPGWLYFQENRLVPNSYASSQIRDSKGCVIEDWTIYPQIYNMEGFTCIGSQIVVNGENVAAFYQQEFDKKLGYGDVQLAEVFCSVLAAVVNMQDSEAEIKTVTSIISSSIQGAELDERSMATLREYLPSSPPYHFILVKSVTASINIVRKNSLLEITKLIGLESISLVYGDDIVVILPKTALSAFVGAFEKHANPSHYALGVSLPFDSIQGIRSSYLQAQSAIELSRGLSGVHSFQDHALERVLAEVDKLDEEIGLIHPALPVIGKYDEKNGTELYRTLKVYLENERNMVKTAQDLCVHRNTMKYRMRKIADMIDADLDDPRERAYIMLSYYLEKPSASCIGEPTSA